MRFRQICFGLALSLGNPAFETDAATLTVFGGPVGGGCNNFACYFGPPTSGTLNTTDGTSFMSYNASVTGRGMFADFSIFGFNPNSGSLGLSSTDVFTINQIGPGGATTVDVTAKLRVSGTFGIANFGSPNGQASAQVRARFTAPRGVPGVTILQENARDISVRPNVDKDQVVIDVGVTLEPEITLRVDVGRSFGLETNLFLNLGFFAPSGNATGGAAFGESALISFDLPDGFSITSQRGYSQGVPAIPLPAGGALLLSALGMIGWVSRRRRLSLTA